MLDELWEEEKWGTEKEYQLSEKQQELEDGVSRLRAGEGQQFSVFTLNSWSSIWSTLVCALKTHWFKISKQQREHFDIYIFIHMFYVKLDFTHLLFI